MSPAPITRDAGVVASPTPPQCEPPPQQTTPQVDTPQAATPQAATPQAATPQAATPQAAPAPVPTPQVATPPATTPQSATPQVPPQPLTFDDIFHHKFMKIIQSWKDDPRSSQLTSKDRKNFIDSAYFETDHEVFGGRQLTDQEIKLRALTKVFYKVLAEEPWSEDWIRPHDVERKLSRFEMHKDSVKLAAEHGITTPREAIAAARRALLAQQQLQKSNPPAKDGVPEKSNLRGPFDDIEIIYIPGTVSSTATNKIDRDTIYPVSVSSVANVLQNHICRDMTRPFAMAQKFVTVTDTEELIKMRQFACDVCDFAPHLLDNDNISLLIVLLILTRSEICRRFENNGIRIEGSTISHRRAECMKQKLGWKVSDERKPFDNVAQEFQNRVKNACFPAPRIHRITKPKPFRKSSSSANSSTPPIGYFAPPQVRYPANANTNIKMSPNGAPRNNFPPPPGGASPYGMSYAEWQAKSQHGAGPSNGAGPSKAAPPKPTGPGSSAAEPMELS